MADDTATGEQLNGNNLEDSDGGLIDIPSRYLPGETEEQPEELQSGHPVYCVPA
jgi:hypothetical protein